MACLLASSERPRSLSLPVELEGLIRAASITSSFVVDSEGAVATPAGSSLGIGNPTDKKLLSALRANAQIVLTSGQTARADNYRMPKTADLAILTRTGVEDLNLVPKPGQELHILGTEVGGFVGALKHMQAIGYERIHVEYGPTGFAQAQPLIDLVVVSGIEEAGVQKFAESNSLTPKTKFHLADLVVWAC